MSKEALEKKEAIVSEIKERFEKSTAAVLVDYLGLTVEESTNLRSNLRESKVDYKIYKNTLIKRAIEGTDFTELEKSLQGSSALAFSYDDVTAPVRIINKAIKDYEKMAFKAGIIEGEYFDAERIKELASIPSREVLIAKLLGSFKAPIGAFARVVNAISEKQGGGEVGEVLKEEAQEKSNAEEIKTEEVAKEEPKTEADKPQEEAKEEAKTEEVKPDEINQDESKVEEAEAPKEEAKDVPEKESEEK